MISILLSISARKASYSFIITEMVSEFSTPSNGGCCLFLYSDSTLFLLAKKFETTNSHLNNGLQRKSSKLHLDLQRDTGNHQNFPLVLFCTIKYHTDV